MSNNLSGDYDVTNQVKTVDAADVNSEVDRIFASLYPGESVTHIDRFFLDAAKLYQGSFPEYRGCDVPYHDIQHMLDVTLAMARLMDGYQRGHFGVEPLDSDHFRLGIVTALFHDCGYMLRLDDTEHKNGAEVTLTHVSRGADFLEKYLPTIGMGQQAHVAAKLIHFTGFEIPVAKIQVPSLRYKLLGTMLGSADIIAQMSDRCYLEKCRDRLYQEFVSAGIARKKLSNGDEQVVYASGDDLVMKTPQFYEGASRRLDNDLQGAHQFASDHFAGRHLYLDALRKNINFAQQLNREGHTQSLKRIPPRYTLGQEERKIDSVA